MPAMHATVLDIMYTRLDVFRDRMVGLIPFDLTHHECIRLIAPSEHIPILTDAAKYADVRTNEQWMSLDIPAIVDGETGLMVNLFMRTHAQKEPPLRPRAPLWQLPVDKHMRDAGDKVISWTKKRLELGRRFGMARYVLSKLAADCETGTEVRYLWPVVMNLCTAGKSDRMDRWMEKYSALKPVRYAPAVSPHLKKMIQDSSALLTSAVLLGEDVQSLEQGEVQINFWNMPSFRFEGVTILRR